MAKQKEEVENILTDKDCNIRIIRNYGGLKIDAIYFESISVANSLIKKGIAKIA